MSTATYPSADHLTDIFYHRWLPAAAPRAVLVIFHGMLEHSGRYAEFAQTLNDHGIAVYAQDHLGHGRSVAQNTPMGHFADENGNAAVISDCRRMLDIAHSSHPTAPLFLMGHSMGSFLARQLLHQFSLPPLSGVILMGSGHQPRPLVQLGHGIAKTFANCFGPTYKSPLLFQLILGGNNRRIHPRHSTFDWLSRDGARVTNYMRDPLNGDNFTARAYADMLEGMLTNYDPARLAAMDTTIPLLLLSGDADPIGSYGKGIRTLADSYRRLGVQDLEMLLYKDARHELLNDTNRVIVTKDILSWMDDHLPNQT